VAPQPLPASMKSTIRSMPWPGSATGRHVRPPSAVARTTFWPTAQAWSASTASTENIGSPPLWRTVHVRPSSVTSTVVASTANPFWAETICRLFRVADPAVPSSATAPGQSAATIACETRAAGTRVVPVMLEAVVVVDEDVLVSALTAPPEACGRDGDPEWQPATTSEATAATAAMVARFISVFLTGFAANVTRY